MANCIEEHRVEIVKEEIRIYDYLVDRFSALPSKKSIKKALKKGRILVDGKSVSSALWVKTNMHIELLEEDTSEQIIYDLELDVVYEDEYFAVVNKPAGLVSSGNQFRTLQNAVAGNLKPSSLIDAVSPPKLVHRLDSSTSGLVIIAKTAQASRKFGDLLANKQIRKKYIAFVQGEIEEKGSIESLIEEKKALSEFKRIESVHSSTFGALNWIELYPLTGRTHQLRIHMSENNSPILGDKIYGDKEHDLKGKGLFLSAISLQFIHPFTSQELNIKIPIPKKFQKYWDGVKKRNASNLSN